MLNLTPIARPFIVHQIQRYSRWADNDPQRQTLDWLLQHGAHTQYGHKHGFADCTGSYERFRDTVPVVDYEDLRPLIDRMIRGEQSVLWPGRCLHYAQSSGTSGGKSKYIPVTDDSLQLNHYRGTRDVLGHYLRMNPESQVLGGRAFILGGSFANELHDLPRDVQVGDLSAHLIRRSPAFAQWLRVPDRHTALLSDWTVKLPALVEASLKADVRSLSGVPSWFLTVLQQVIERAGARTIHDVWPNLEVFFHGGISFEPYRDIYRHITDAAKMRYQETYNASEGFFALQTTPEPGPMQLVLDAGVFFEFEDIDAGADSPLLPWWETVPDRTYAMIITAPNGLWRYRLGDTVTMYRTHDGLPAIRIAGRTKSFINAFGEELMVHNADTAIARASAYCGARVRDYTAAPCYATDHSRGHHQWLIEWIDAPRDAAEFARVFDHELQRVNSDYQAKRSGDIFLAPPEIINAPDGLFDSWLAATGKRGGQRKVPRLSNDRRIMDQLLELRRKA